MLEISPSRPEEWPVCKALWQTVFGDSDNYVDNFHANQNNPLLVLRDEEGIQSMLVLLELEHQWGNGGLTPAAYLYALATDPRARGKGYAGFLMAYTDFYLQGQGVPLLCTVPAQPSLEAFFTKNGFHPSQRVDQYLGPIPPGLPAPVGSVIPVEPGEYRGLRENHLAGLAHAAYPESYLKYQATVCALFGGGLFRVDTPRGPACAIAYPEGEILNVQELLAPAGEQGAVLSALSAQFRAPRCQVRTPVGRCELAGAASRVLGMVKGTAPAAPTTALEESFFSLAFE